MSAAFSAPTLQRLEEASRVLIAPMAGGGVDPWRLQVTRAMRELFGADSAMFGLPHPEAPYYVSENVHPDALRATGEYVADRARNVGASPDPLVNTFLERREQLGVEVFDFDRLAAVIDGQQRAATFYNEVWARYGLDRVHAFYVTTPGGVANLHLHHTHAANPFGADALVLLGALLPSFKAGLDALGRFDAQRSALRALDAVADALVVLDADGRERHRNTALLRLLADEPERGLVEGALWQLGRDLRRLAFPRRFETAPALAPMRREVATRRGRYTLSATLVPPGAFGVSEVALVTVAADVAPPPLAAADVQARLGLTPREAEVALLVAEGLSNREVADRLFVASGTVKRHLEGIYGKLGVSTRAAVAGRLHQPGGAV